MKAIYFDMDGTIADLYGVKNWLDCLNNELTKPYREAKALVDMRKLGKLLNLLQERGYKLGIVSWLSKNGTPTYNARVAAAKKAWLKHHLSAVQWDEIKLVPYGTPKHNAVDNPSGILFDDAKRIRASWTGEAHDVHNILEVLSALVN